MSRMLPVLRREFTQAISSKAFLVGTILGPLLMIGLFAAQFLILTKSGGGSHRITVVDATGAGMGERLADAVKERAAAGPSFITRATYDFRVEHATAQELDTRRKQLSDSVTAEVLDGFLILPPATLAGTGIRYEGSNATNSQMIGELRGAVQRLVQSERLRQAGIDESQLGSALMPVSMEIAKTGEEGGAGAIAAAKVLAFLMAFAIYMVVIMYGQSIMSSVQEEKRDRVVELIVSSVRAKDLLVGKVLGIGAAGVLQMTIWVTVAGLLMAFGNEIAAALGASPAVVAMLSQQSLIPDVPLSVGIMFVLYFAGGFLLFATMFAVVGAIVTTAQEAQQFVFPILLPFMLGFFMAMPATDNPNSAIAVIGSIVPFTSPMVMPVRATITGVDWVQTGISLALLYITAALMIFLAAKIYRTAIFATGKKPSMGELVRWMRAS